MKFMISAATAFILMTSMAFADAVQPFGFERGVNPSTYEAKKNGDGYTWIVDSAPNPHPDFALYGLYATPNEGICSVIALSKENDSDDYGIAVRSDMESFARALDSKYGPSTLTDELLDTGNFYSRGDNWSYGVAQNRRFYFRSWKAFPENVTGLKSIEMSAAVVGTSTTFTKLTYQFDNFEACGKEEETLKAESF